VLRLARAGNPRLYRQAAWSYRCLRKSSTPACHRIRDPWADIKGDGKEILSFSRIFSIQEITEECWAERMYCTEGCLDKKKGRGFVLKN